MTPGRSPGEDLAAPTDELDGLRLRLAQAEARARARDDFLAIAAHELRSPMNALVLQLDVLERMARASGSPGFLQRLAIARRTVAGFVRRATVLLDVVRLNDGALQLAPQEFGLGGFVDGVLATYADEAQFHGAALRADIDPDVTVRWDPQASEQVLSNLVTNAIKYAGGHEIVVRAATEGAAVRLTVEDQGPGIAAADAARIFDRFERAVARGGPIPGLGIGLWIVGRLVSAQGGTVQVEPRPGGGTRFHVVLPRAASCLPPPCHGVPT